MMGGFKRESDIRLMTRRAYLQEHPFAFTVVLGCAISSVVLLTILPLGFGSDPAIFMFLDPVILQALWIIMYGVGGLFMTIGMWNLIPRLEASGAFLLGSVFVVNWIAILVERGLEAAVVNSLFLFCAIGALVRAIFVLNTTAKGSRRGT